MKILFFLLKKYASKKDLLSEMQFPWHFPKVSWYIRQTDRNILFTSNTTLVKT